MKRPCVLFVVLLCFLFPAISIRVLFSETQTPSPIELADEFINPLKQPEKEAQQQQPLPPPISIKPSPLQPNLTVSVVIPVHNSEKYLERCIGTLRNQSLRGMEFIFVDDCSTDNSTAVIRKHALADPRIRLILNTANSGPGASRNAGIAAAKGEYVGFLDSDDYLSPTFYETLYNAATSRSAEDRPKAKFDIAKGQLAHVRRDKIEYHQMSTERAFAGRVYKYFYAQHYTGIFRKGLLDQHPDARYGNASLGEDLVFLAKICFYARNIVLTNNAVYYYDTHKGSLASTSGYESLLALHASHKEMASFCANSGSRTFFRDRLVWIKSLVDKSIAKYKSFEESRKPEERNLYEDVKAFREYIDTIAP